MNYCFNEVGSVPPFGIEDGPMYNLCPGLKQKNPNEPGRKTSLKLDIFAHF